MSIKSFIRNYIWKTSEPWADFGYNGKQLVVRDWNQAFLNEQKEKLGYLVDGKKDQEVVQLFVDRENIEREEPRLDVVHSGIEKDGRIKVELDWNKAFIKHLAENGITGETDEEAVQNYLILLTHNELEGDVDPDDPAEFLTRGQLDSAFAEIDQELASEFNQALEQAQHQQKQKKGRRRQVKRTQ